MPLINREINRILTWSANCLVSEGDRATTFAIRDTKLYVPVVTLSAQDNTKLLQQLKSGFRRTISWNKYQLKISTERPNEYLDYLIDPSFQGINRLFVLSSEDNAHRTKHTGYFLLKIEIKDHNVFFDQPVKSDPRTYSIWKIMIDQGDDYTTGCLVDYPYAKENYKLIVIDLIKQQALYADPKAMQQIKFTGNLNWNQI